MTHGIRFDSLKCVFASLQFRDRVARLRRGVLRGGIGRMSTTPNRPSWSSSKTGAYKGSTRGYRGIGICTSVLFSEFASNGIRPNSRPKTIVMESKLFLHMTSSGYGAESLRRPARTGTACHRQEDVHLLSPWSGQNFQEPAPGAGFYRR